MNYQLDMKQDYVQGVEKIDTNGWEVDLVGDSINVALSKFDKKQQEKKKISLNKQMMDREREKQAQNFKENDFEEEAMEKQLRKVQAKISGLKNRILERAKVIEKQTYELKQLRFRKEKIALQCGIMKQMIQHENEQFEKYRSFDFSYMTKTYKLADVGSKRGRNKANQFTTGFSRTNLTKNSQPSPDVKQKNSPMVSSIPSRGVQAIKLSAAADETSKRRSSIMQMYMDSPINMNNNQGGAMAKSHFGAAVSKFQ